MKKLHNCTSINDIKSSAFTIDVVKEEGAWYLCCASYSTQKSVDDGEANSIGEELSNIYVNIKYCPFCGMLLSVYGE